MSAVLASLAGKRVGVGLCRRQSAEPKEGSRCRAAARAALRGEATDGVEQKASGGSECEARSEEGDVQEAGQV